jgi:hypothetical protein
MRPILIAALLAALTVPAAVFAADPPGQDRENAARACSTLRTAMGVTTFRLTYGTAASNHRNAFGRCVSQWTRTERLNRQSAQSSCEAERNDPNFAATHGGKTFAEFYGTGPKHRNAFGRCVSSKAKTASAEDRRDTLNAARKCKAERQRLGVTAFRTEYGRNANDRNAFGKCVSKLAKEQNN